MIAVLVLLLFMSSVTARAHAAQGVVVEGALNQSELAASGEPDNPAGSSGGDSIVDEGGPFERIIASFIEFPVRVVKAVGSTLGLKHINVLVFGTDTGNGAWYDHSLWSEKEAKFIRTVYWAFASVCLPMFLIVIITTAFKLMYSAVSPGAREEAINSIWRWFAVLVMVLAVPLVTDLILALSGVMTDAIRMAFEGVSSSLGLGVSLGDFSSGAFSGDLDIRTGSVIGTALVKVFFVFAWLQFNIIYFIRKVVLSAMVCFAPVAGLFWAMNRNVPAVAIWFGELGSNALMPVAHAIVLCIILGLTDLKHVSEKGTWFHVLIAIYMLMPLAEVIRNSVQSLFVRWAGVDESGIASKATLAAFGLGGLLGLGRLAGTFAPPGSPLQQGPAFPGGGPGGVSSGGARFGGVPVAAGTAGVPFSGSAGFAAAGGAQGGFASGGVHAAAGPAEALDGYAPAVSGYGPAGPAGTAGGYAPGGVHVPSGQAGAAENGSGVPGVGEAPPLGGKKVELFPWVTGDQGPGEQREKPLLGRVADRAVGTAAAAAGAVAGWTVKAAAGAVPGMGAVGGAVGNAVDRGLKAGVRAAAGHAVLQGKLVEDLRKPDGSSRYFSGDFWKDARNVVIATKGVARGEMDVSDLMYARSLEEAVRPRYSGAARGLA